VAAGSCLFENVSIAIGNRHDRVRLHANAAVRKSRVRARDFDQRCFGSVEVTGEELREWCRGKIASFKIPRYWRFVDAFPMTVTGKVQKFKMRETSVAELGLESAAGTRTA